MMVKSQRVMFSKNHNKIDHFHGCYQNHRVMDLINSHPYQNQSRINNSNKKNLTIQQKTSCKLPFQESRLGDQVNIIHRRTTILYEIQH